MLNANNRLPVRGSSNDLTSLQAQSNLLQLTGVTIEKPPQPKREVVMMKTPGSNTRKAELIASKNLKRASSKQVVEGDVVKYR